MPVDSLFTPAQIGPLRLANRTAVAPMTRTSATPDGYAGLRVLLLGLRLGVLGLQREVRTHEHRRRFGVEPGETTRRRERGREEGSGALVHRGTLRPAYRPGAPLPGGIVRAGPNQSGHDAA